MLPLAWTLGLLSVAFHLWAGYIVMFPLAWTLGAGRIVLLTGEPVGPLPLIGEPERHVPLMGEPVWHVPSPFGSDAGFAVRSVSPLGGIHCHAPSILVILG